MAVSFDTLKTRKEFLAVQKGERRRGRYFLLEILKQPTRDAKPRVGFTVTKKQGNAVERNRMKRRLRAVARSSIAFQGATDYVLVGRRDVLNADFSLLVQELNNRVASKKTR